MALALDKASGWLDVLSAALFLWPLTSLLSIFRTFEYQDAPHPIELMEKYPFYPRTFLKVAFNALCKDIDANMPLISGKARDLNRAMSLLFWVIVVVLGVRVGETIYGPILSIIHALSTRGAKP